MKKLALILLLIGFNTYSQNNGNHYGNGNGNQNERANGGNGQHNGWDEVEEDPEPEAPIADHIPIMCLTAIIIAIFYFNSKKDD